MHKVYKSSPWNTKELFGWTNSGYFIIKKLPKQFPENFENFGSIKKQFIT